MSATNETVAEHIDAASSEAVAQAVKESSVSDARDDSHWLGHLIRGMTTLLIVLVTLVAYHFLMVVPNKQKFAVVDIGEVLNIKELQVTIAAMKPDSQLQQTQAFKEIAKFAKVKKA